LQDIYADTVITVPITYSRNLLWNAVRDNSSDRSYLIADVGAEISTEDASSSNPSSSDLHICSVLDFYLAENVSALQFNSLMGFSNDATSYHSYQYHHWDMNMFFDLDERNTLFPFQNGNSPSGNEDGVDDTSMYLQSGIGGCYGDLELITGDLPDLLEVDSGVKSVRGKHVTLVLDLDGKLIAFVLAHFFFFYLWSSIQFVPQPTPPPSHTHTHTKDVAARSIP
jgi:hypothetical protein